MTLAKLSLHCILKVYEQIGMFLVQTPLDAWLGLGAQTRYEAPSDLPVAN